MRADRILSILLLLQNNGKMTTKELAKKLEVSERTVVRDMEALSMAGVPVYAERGSQGGWRLADGYRTQLTGMRAEEIISLLTSSHSGYLADLGLGEHFDRAMQKLLASSPETIRKDTEQWWRKLYIDGAGWHEAKETYPYLMTVQDAVWQERKLRISYQRGDHAAVRVVRPLGLVAKRSVWYLVAMNEEGEYRTFRISRIAAAEMLDEPFERPADFQLNEYWERSMEDFKTRLPRYVVSLKLREASFELLKKERFVTILSCLPAKDGWIEAEVDMETSDYACRTVLSFGLSALVVAPEELRTKVAAEARAVDDIYSGK